MINSLENYTEPGVSRIAAVSRWIVSKLVGGGRPIEPADFIDPEDFAEPEEEHDNQNREISLLRWDRIADVAATAVMVSRCVGATALRVDGWWTENTTNPVDIESQPELDSHLKNLFGSQDDMESVVLYVPSLKAINSGDEVATRGMGLVVTGQEYGPSRHITINGEEFDTMGPHHQLALQLVVSVIEKHARTIYDETIPPNNSL